MSAEVGLLEATQTNSALFLHVVIAALPLGLRICTWGVFAPLSEPFWSTQTLSHPCKPGQHREWWQHHLLQTGTCHCYMEHASSENLPTKTHSLPIWLIILNAMSSCRTTSIYWNQGLISLLARGTCTEKTMSLASSIFAKGSSKLWICWHWFDPHGMSQPAALCRLMHLVAR